MVRTFVVISTFFMVLTFVSGCGPPAPPTSAPTPTLLPGELIPFETLARGEAQCTSFDQEVRTYFITNPTLLDTAFSEIFYEQWDVSPNPRSFFEEAKRTDFTTHALIAFHRRCKPDTGDEIIVKTVLMQEDGSLSVYAELWHPRIANPSATSYQHIIRIPWTGSAEPTIDLVDYTLNGSPTRVPSPISPLHSD